MGDQLNVGKYTSPVDPPCRTSARVVFSLDKADFVRKVAPVAPVAEPIAIQTARQPATGTVASPAETVVLPSSLILDDRGDVITRSACINSASAILSSGSRAARPAEVIALAGQFEAWAPR